VTLWVSREPGTALIRLQVTHGPLTVVVDEHEAHMRIVHAELGKLLEQLPAAAAPAGEF